MRVVQPVKGECYHCTGHEEEFCRCEVYGWAKNPFGGNTVEFYKAMKRRRDMDAGDYQDLTEQVRAERAKASVLTVANKNTLTSTRKELNDTCEKLLTGKGEAYAHSKLDNETGQRFKKAAAELGITPIQVAMVYASKHWASIQKWCQDGCKDDIVGDEPIAGRIADLRNYLDFIYYLYKDAMND